MFVSTTSSVRFVPSDQLGRAAKDQVAYYLKPASVYDRARLRSALVGLGARLAGFGDLLAAMRAGIAVLLPGDGDAAKRVEILGLLDAFEAADAAVRAARAAGESAEDIPETPAELVAAVENLERMIARGYEPLASMLAAHELHQALAPIEAFRLLCVGWDNAGLAFARQEDGIPHALVEDLSAEHEAHIVEAGYRALVLSRAPRGSEKNLASPSRSDSFPEISPTASNIDPSGPLPTAKDGGSPESGSSV